MTVLKKIGRCFLTLTVAAASLAGGTAGALLLGKIKPDVLKKIFAAVMIVSGVMMLVLG